MSTTTTMETTVDLTRSEAMELRALEGQLKAELRLWRLAGLSDSPRAVEARELRRGVRERLEGWHDAQSAEQSERYRQAAVRDAELEARRAAAQAQTDAAAELLEGIFETAAPVPLAEIEGLARDAGIGDEAILQAGRSMGLRAGRRYGSGNRVEPDVYWSRGQFLAGFKGMGQV